MIKGRSSILTRILQLAKGTVSYNEATQAHFAGAATTVDLLPSSRSECPGEACDPCTSSQQHGWISPLALSHARAVPIEPWQTRMLHVSAYLSAAQPAANHASSTATSRRQPAAARATSSASTSLKPPASSKSGPTASSSGRTAGAIKNKGSHSKGAPTSGSLPPSVTSTSASNPAGPPDLSVEGMEDLFKALIQPLPLGHSTNSALLNHAVQINRTLFIDPAKTLESTMRALYVIKQVLKDDGHIYILNSNPLLQPLLREAALCCINRNVWFMTDAWATGTLDSAATTLFQEVHQPNRKLLAARGLDMVNQHCMQPNVLDRAAPKLHMLDKWKLFARRRIPGHMGAVDLLRAVVALENQTTRLPLPRMLQGTPSKLRLLVVLDLTHDLPAVEEAYARNVMTVSLVNAHSDLSRISYPVYAGEYHLRFQHFFLDWIIKVANVPPPQQAAP